MSAQVGAQTSPTTTFEAWVAAKGNAVGPPGTTSVLTPLAARELWDREARRPQVPGDGARSSGTSLAAGAAMMCSGNKGKKIAQQDFESEKMLWRPRCGPTRPGGV